MVMSQLPTELVGLHGPAAAGRRFAAFAACRWSPALAGLGKSRLRKPNDATLLK